MYLILSLVSSINGLPVTKIGPDAFYMCEDITSVYIPASVKYIDTYAFSGCKSLTSVVLEKNSQLEKNWCGRIFILQQSC